MSSAKYIEGLENRMRRLEGLLKMAGIADSETDIPSIERRLQQAQQSQHNDLNSFSAATAAARASIENAGKSRTGSLHSTPPQDSNSSPRVTDSPVSQEDKEHEVEALSDMMCSLVTNNCGETRYIGMYKHILLWYFYLSKTKTRRFLLWLFNLLTPRHPMGQ